MKSWLDPVRVLVVTAALAMFWCPPWLEAQGQTTPQMYDGEIPQNESHQGSAESKAEMGIMRGASPAPRADDAERLNISPTALQPLSAETDEPPVEPLISRRYGTLLLEDIAYVLSAPIHWKVRDWELFGADAAAVIGTAIVLDRPVQKAMQRNRSEVTNTIAGIFNPLGNEYALAVPGGFYLAGVVWHNDKARAVAQDSVAASLVEAGIITPAVKLAVGRSRPKDGKGAYHLEPFGGEGVFSSGHTGEAFALASVIAEHYDPLWIKCTAYGIAGLVGFARIVDNAHFTSDVVTGALIGITVGQAVVRFNKQQRLRFSPLTDGKTKGLKVVYAF